MFDSYEGNTEDYSNLKSDNKEHARTSIESLKRFAREMAATPVDTVKRKQIKAWMRDPYRRAPNKAQYWPQPNDKARRELEDSKLWLLALSSDPKFAPELELEDGKNNGRARNEVGGLYDIPEWDGDEETYSKYEAHGLMHTERHGCNEPLLSIAMRGDEYERANPTSHEVRLRCLAKRGEVYKRHAERQAKRLRWRGMEDYDAPAKADAKLREGVSRRPVESNAKPLPDIGVLHEMFRVEDGKLIRTKAVRGGKVGDVLEGRCRVDGERYLVSRLIYAMETGSDPADKIVSGGVATHFKNANGTVRDVTPDLTAYDLEAWEEEGLRRFEAEVKLDGKTTSIGVYRTEDMAANAVRLYIRSLNMGL